MALDTHIYRLAMVVYAREHNLAPEKGVDVTLHGPLGKPFRRLLKRVQDHLVARGKLKAKYADGTLNTATQKLLVPPLAFGDQVAHWCLKEVGVHEVPWGSNDGVRVRYYESFTGGYGEPWCASFRSAALRECGYKGPVSARAWDFDHIGTLISTGAQHIGLAKVGDAVTFNFGAGHIGTYLSHRTGFVKTVDGNTSDQVAVRERPFSEIQTITRQGK